jgi:sugar phosphate isomerase/epimerase
VPGTLQIMKQLGFTELEVSGYYGLTAPQFKKQMDILGLKCTSMLFDYKRYETALDSIIMEAKLFGAKYVGFAWIPHEGGFKKADAEKAIALMNSAGEKLKAAGLKLFYHLHGYEFLPDGQETLFDLMAKQTKPGSMYFQLDVFWVTRGGADPALLLQKYPGRFCSLHVKDIQIGLATGNYTGGAPDETSVVIGKGQVNWVKLLKSAIKTGVQQYFIEDESPEVLKQIPQSMRYLKNLK